MAWPVGFYSGYEYGNHPYNYGFGWFFGSPLNQIWDTSYPPNATEAFLDFNETAVPTGNLGFTFDVVPVQNEVSALQNVVAEYLNALVTGSVNPDDILQDFLARLEANGVDTLIAEIQQQLDDFNAAR